MRRNRANRGSDRPAPAVAVPTREGYTFAGWTGSNGDTPQASVTIGKGASGNLHFKANWTKAS